jgi:hypothetical protein
MGGVGVLSPLSSLYPIYSRLFSYSLECWWLGWWLAAAGGGLRRWRSCGVRWPAMANNNNPRGFDLHSLVNNRDFNFINTILKNDDNDNSTSGNISHSPYSDSTTTLTSLSSTFATTMIFTFHLSAQPSSQDSPYLTSPNSGTFSHKS